MANKRTGASTAKPIPVVKCDIDRIHYVQQKACHCEMCKLRRWALRIRTAFRRRTRQ